jgi:transposase
MTEEQFPELALPLAIKEDLETNPERLREAVANAVKAAGGNITKAAAILGVNRRSIHRWIARYSITFDDLPETETNAGGDTD